VEKALQDLARLTELIRACGVTQLFKSVGLQEKFEKEVESKALRM